MPSACCAVGCANSKSQKKGLFFYNIPKDSVRRQKWINAIGTGQCTPTIHSRRCSEHFVSDRPNINLFTSC
ncbi:hypothetical protein NQD34_011291 [Periophthalmus magnuspinnatus]|nr:hypothetical protein NQD34_011291 [Periophthalmus magnuspinnatus]